MNTPWSAEQREWLQALGYDLLVHAPQAEVVAEPGDGRPGAPTDTARPAAAMRRGDEVADPLLRALLRAARTEALDEVRAIAGDTARLRADPAAKRAAWPRLRALRARRRR